MQRVVILCAFLFWLLLGSAAVSAAAAPALDVAEGNRWPLSGHLAVWRDPSGTASIEDVARKPAADFTRLEDKLSLGFTADAVWLRFSLHATRPAQDPGPLWLELSQNVMEDARLFVPSANGGYVQVRPGPQAATSAQRIEHRLPLFEIPVEQGPRIYFLRLASSTSMSTNLVLWEPRSFIKASAPESFIWGWVFGAYTLVVVFYFVFWLWTREPIHLMYTSYVAINCMAAVFTGGWPLLIPDLTTSVWLKGLGLSISLSVVVGVWFTVKFLQMGDIWPRLVRACLVLITAVCTLSVIGVLAGHYRDVIPLVQLTSVLTIVLTMLVGIYLARHGRKEARLFLLAFSFFYIGIAWRFMRNFGLLEPNFWNDNSYQIGAFIHMLVMSTGIFAGYSRLRRDKQVAEARAATEVKLREEQRDFVSMVSHELRTPLSIIGASSDNLAQEAALSDKSLQRVHKIIKATERMRQLMDNYLSKERLLLDGGQLRLAPVDLVVLCRQVRDELDDAVAISVDIQASRPSLLAECDASLMKIAMRNLVSNALRHSASGMRVVIALESRARSVEIRVRDQGSGIPDDEVEHIFTRFYRGRGALDQPGAGLGLYLVRSIAERHGGWVSVQNLPIRGCEFRLQLPQ